ncbi:sulfite exporter TauE/SafE family protein [uncultured Umboniibacter sp.]|uniref:sulfite exporter TauE/SafE family protein n=1 Tax=uncultured Umboniibacter sp. TaxID=1798917 RepID=UPI0026122648|nr:sulfite exporter TauE/SafE family protein [uncultured Umboniibacter sp.]
MIEAILAAFIFGLAGSTHCLSMCGGIAMAVTVGGNQANRLLALSYNLGRLACYLLLGFLVGFLGELIAFSAETGIVLRFIAAALLVAMGVYLLGFKQVLGWLERLGAKAIWQPLRPIASKFLPIRNHRGSLVAGAIWGLLPCGMVYTALAWSTASASPLTGALTMLAFGLGTFPAMLGVALLGGLGSWFKSPVVRSVLGVLLILFGTFNAFQQMARLTVDPIDNSHHHQHH